jgi:hypothetical protein
MADMTNILIQDDTDTTVTFLPVSNANQALVWRANLAGVPVNGQARLTATWEKLKSGDFRLSAKLEVPVLETIGAAAASGYVAAPKVAYVMVGIFTLFAPARSSAEDRANAVRMMTHLLQGANNVADSGLDARSAASGAFASAYSGHFLPYSFINVVMPT